MLPDEFYIQRDKPPLACAVWDTAQPAESPLEPEAGLPESEEHF
jgi:hypothetical protein